MTVIPVRDDWTLYRADDPATWPTVIPAGSGWCYEVTRRWMDEHVVELAGNFRAEDRPAYRWRSLTRAVSIPGVVAWRVLWFSAPWIPTQEAE